MPEPPGSHRTQIWIALITVIGGVLTAFVVNADKWFARPPGAPAQAASPAAPAPALAGDWHDEAGARYRFTQDGARFDYIHTAADGAYLSRGEGRLSAGDLAYGYEAASGSTGRCAAQVNARATRITGSCVAADDAWTFTIER